ncbi:MAG: hypothetical protein ABH834_03410 [Candidatus Altiarchaeota archaeon]
MRPHYSSGQSSIEWLMTHAWSIIVVLSVSAVLFYAGVFEATGRPRFEGLNAASIRPLPDQVKLYSDGVLVLSVGNTRPYNVYFEWVEVAPIANRSDVIRTTLNVMVGQGDIGVFSINASNLDKNLPYVDFHITFSEYFTAGGKVVSHEVSGLARRIEVEQGPNICDQHLVCSCSVHEDCPLVCQRCHYPGGPDRCNNRQYCASMFGQDYECRRTEEHPEGECVFVG